MGRINSLFNVHPRSVGFFRICLGLLLIATYLNFLPYLNSFFTDHGAFPRMYVLWPTAETHLSLNMANGSFLFQLLLWGIAVFFAILIILNIRTRIAAISSLLLFQSLAYRATEMKFGLHEAMLAALFWALFIPFEKSRSLKKPFLSWACIGLTINTFSILFGAGIAKFNNYDFWIGNAVALEQLTSYYANVNPITRILNSLPYAMKLLSRVIPLFEMAVVPLLFIPLFNQHIRLVVLGFATLMLGCTTLSIHVGIFPLIPLVCLYVFIPESFWSWCDQKGIRGIQFRKPKIPTIPASIIKVGRIVAIGFIFLFALKTWNHYGPHRFKVFRFLLDSDWVVKSLGFFHLHQSWDWIYNSPMKNRFFIVEVDRGHEKQWRNVTNVKYRPFFYNYEMNYATALLRSKSRLQEYAQYHCRQDEAVKFIRFFEVWDPQNKHRNLPEFNQEKLSHAISNTAAFYHFNCIAGTEGLIPSSVAPLLKTGQPVSLTQFPILSWRQDFAGLQVNQSMDGNPLKLSGKIFTKGFGTHANSNILFDILGATRFRATAGLDDEVKNSFYASVILKVKVDGQTQYKSEILKRNSGPVQIDLRFKKAKELELIVEDAAKGSGTTLNFDDHVSWGDPEVW